MVIHMQPSLIPRSLIQHCVNLCMCRDYDAENKRWGWAKEAPASNKVPGNPRPSNPAAKCVSWVSWWYWTGIRPGGGDCTPGAAAFAKLCWLGNNHQQLTNRIHNCLPPQPQHTLRMRKKLSEHEKALKEFKCLMCKDTLTQPLSTPCGGCLFGCADLKQMPCFLCLDFCWPCLS